MSPQAFDTIRAISWAGHAALAPDGRRIGDVGGIVVDRQSGAAQWLLIHTRAHGSRCAPVAGLVGVSGRVHVPYDNSVVLAGSPVPRDGSLSARHEYQLCTHFRVHPPTRGATLSKWERRRTTSLAYLAPNGVVQWEPEPRYDGDRRALQAAADRDRRGMTNAPESHTLTVIVADGDVVAGQQLSAVINHHPRLLMAGLYRDGPQAITAALAHPPDAIVLAARMPLLDGTEVRERLYAADQHVVCVLIEDGGSESAEAIDDRTVRVPRSLSPPHVVRVIEVLAMTQTERSGIR